MIETKRLFLQKFQASDLDTYYNLMHQSDVYQWLGKGKEISKDHAKKMIDYYDFHWNKYQIGTWAVFLKDTKACIGHCGFNYVKDLDEFELLYAFGKQYWHKGYATESAKAAMDWLKKDMKLKKIIALSYPKNQRSIHVIEKLGFDYMNEITLFNTQLNLYKQEL